MLNKDNAFYTYLFTVLNIMAKHDLEYTDEEFHFVTNAMKKYKDALPSNTEFKQVLLSVKEAQMSPTDLLKETSQHLRIQEMLKAFSLAFKVAVIDGTLDEREEKILQEIQEHSGLPKRHFVSFLNRSKRELKDFQIHLSKLPYDHEVRKKELDKFFAKDEVSKCPSCENLYLSTFHIQEVEFDFCDQGCLGIWADTGELATFIDEHDKNLPNFDVDVKSIGKETDRICPRCPNEKLYEIQFHNELSAHIDKCPDCSGVWFDNKEMAEIKEFLKSKGLGGRLEVALANLSEKGYKVILR